MENGLLDNNLNKNSAPRWAGFWVRVGASLVDGLVFLPLTGLSLYNQYNLKSLPLQLFMIILMASYKPFMENKYGATLGKMALKIKVVNYNFEKINLNQAVIRYSPWLVGAVINIYFMVLLFGNAEFLGSKDVMKVSEIQKEVFPQIYSILSSLLVLFSCLVVAFSNVKQGMHDQLAKTYCIYK